MYSSRLLYTIYLVPRVVPSSRKYLLSTRALNPFAGVGRTSSFIAVRDILVYGQRVPGFGSRMNSGGTLAFSFLGAAWIGASVMFRYFITATFYRALRHPHSGTDSDSRRVFESVPLLKWGRSS